MGRISCVHPLFSDWNYAETLVEMVIDPQLQQQSAVTTPKPLVNVQAPTPTPQYYTAYQHYPYYQQYLAQAQQQHAAATAAHAHASAPVTTRATFTVPTTPAPQTPVTTAHTPAIAQTAVPTTTAHTTTTQATQSSNLDTNDIATLNDALGSAGVDLRAEEESLQRHDLQVPSHLQPASSFYSQSRSYEDRSRKQPTKPAFNTVDLGKTMRTIGTEYKVTRIPEDSVNYLALALRARLQDLVEAMIDASRYRKEAQFDRPANFYESLQPGATQGETPMWSIVVRSDVAKQLAVLERVEREEEMRIRRERKERQELQTQHAANLAAQVDGSAMMGIQNTGPSAMMGVANGNGAGAAAAEDEQPKKKKKKDGPGVTARNLRRLVWANIHG
ncbi:hypothetical protein NMY22_g19914 [Coprinellus aureogranulatus]|nr:hypothetical protein NMY22_g19914 [Coprinellus aureogranulatus]